jgi:hypothetical protein
MSEIITENTTSLSRPIQLIGNVPYFATIVPIRTDKGQVKAIWVVSSADGKEKYSEFPLDGHNSFSEAPFHIDLVGKTPRKGSTLSAKAYQDHIEGKSLLPVDAVFKEVSACIDSFVCFDGSFGSQKDMADFLACWLFGTYATDVFHTTGYLWPVGEKGSGKTQCLKTLTRLSFMGQSITSGSTFASIRDEAALGATLGFDDCENIAKMDQNKRELLLAGNTKGSGFMHKVPGAKDGVWQSVYIDAFAPRMFTSIGLPDDVLASRTILVSLQRSDDLAKTRRKPTIEDDWLINPNMLRDQIWLRVSRELSAILAAAKAVNGYDKLAGRDFDIFQSPLAIAYWAEHSHSLKGLYDRMIGVMEAYHSVKHKNHLPSLQHVALQALLNILNKQKADSQNVPTYEIVLGISAVCDDMDITDESLKSADAQKVGTLLGRLGFVKSGTHGSQRSWKLNRGIILEKAKVNGITLEDEEQPISDEKVAAAVVEGHDWSKPSTASPKEPLPW